MLFNTNMINMFTACLDSFKVTHITLTVVNMLQMRSMIEVLLIQNKWYIYCKYTSSKPFDRLLNHKDAANILQTRSIIKVLCIQMVYVLQVYFFESPLSL